MKEKDSESNFTLYNFKTNQEVGLLKSISLEKCDFSSDVKLQERTMNIDISNNNTDISWIKFINSTTQEKPKYKLQSKSIVKYDNTSYKQWLNNIDNNIRYISKGKYQVLKRHKSKRINKKLNKKYGLQIIYILLTELNDYNCKTQELNLKIL